MSEQLKLIRSSIHPMLVVLPIGSFFLALVFDLAGAVSGFPIFSEAGYWNLVPGVVIGLLAAVTGFVDLFVLPAAHPLRRRAGEHAVVNLWSVGLFALVWLARTGAERPDAGAAVLLVEFIAFAGLIAGAWLGRRLSAHLTRPAGFRSSPVAGGSPAR